MRTAAKLTGLMALLLALKRGNESPDEHLEPRGAARVCAELPQTLDCRSSTANLAAGFRACWAFQFPWTNAPFHERLCRWGSADRSPLRLPSKLQGSGSFPGRTGSCRTCLPSLDAQCRDRQHGYN